MTHIPRRVLVTEAAGSVGRATLDLLARRQMKATGLGLRDPGGLPLDRMVVGSAGDPEVVRRAPVGAKAVIHLAALPALGRPGRERCCTGVRAPWTRRSRCRWRTRHPADIEDITRIRPVRPKFLAAKRIGSM
ncbi:hypothetical protein [Nonomuraea rubra]|uniref:hypothetical protein n=1 Tax=Nonomuraea rubra TaxID=46180 RepID=UPI0031EA7119